MVRLGAPDDIGERLLPLILKNFAQTHSVITVDVTVDMSISLKRRFNEQRFGLALIHCATKYFEVDAEVVYCEPLVWTGAKSGTAHRRDLF